MAVPLTRLSCWWWGGKEKEQVGNGSAGMNSFNDWGFGLREPESLRFRSVKGVKMASSSSRKVKRKWKSREERRRIDKEYDMVLVPSDGVCLSGSESDDSDWSIGWLEPHAPDFQSDDEGDNCFAVLVPCYRHDCKEFEEEFEPRNKFFTAIRNLPNEYSSAQPLYLPPRSFLPPQSEISILIISQEWRSEIFLASVLQIDEGQTYMEQWLSSLRNF